MHRQPALSPPVRDETLAPFITRIHRENLKETERIATRHAQAYEEALHLAREMAKADPTLRKVILFGSTLPGRTFRMDSDIDLAIQGGRISLLERMAQTSSFKVDIIRLDDARDAIRGSILKEGHTLYASPQD